MAVGVIPVKLTYRDYVTWPDDGRRRYELYEGEVYMVYPARPLDTSASQGIWKLS